MKCVHTTAEAAIGKGDSLDVYMKSVKDKLDKGTVHEMKLQINKLKKVCSSHVSYVHVLLKKILWIIELKQILDSLGYSLGYITIRMLGKYLDTQQIILKQ